MFKLFDAFRVVKNEKEFKNFLIDLCTPREIQDLEDRFLIAQLLFDKKLSQREIAKKVSCSITTVTRVARFLEQEKYKGYQKVLNRLTRFEILETLKECKNIIKKNKISSLGYKETTEKERQKMVKKIIEEERKKIIEEIVEEEKQTDLNRLRHPEKDVVK
jgi:TrpR-related protein YerC/YecD